MYKFALPRNVVTVTNRHARAPSCLVLTSLDASCHDVDEPARDSSDHDGAIAVGGVQVADAWAAVEGGHIAANDAPIAASDAPIAATENANHRMHHSLHETVRNDR